MDRVATYSFADDFIAQAADFIDHNFAAHGVPYERLAVVFGGKRPALFLNREFSRRLKRPFAPPRYFSIDEFMEYLLHRREDFSKIPELEASYLIYDIAAEVSPQILKGREKFSQFLPWAGQIQKFIEQLDLEKISGLSLENVQLKAAIGYDLPESINIFLRHIVAIREEFHRRMKKRRSYSRGLIYLSACEAAEKEGADEFASIIFCDLFYLHRCEKEACRRLYDKAKAVFLFQGDEDDWPVLKDLGDFLGFSIKPPLTKKRIPSFKVYAGFDTHSQCAWARKIVKETAGPAETVIVAPAPENIIPLLAEVTSEVSEFNVSMGYPLSRSSLYWLFELIFAAQASKNNGRYYAKDYLRLLSHPLIKNLRLHSDGVATRVLVHKIEEILSGMALTPLSGSLFLDLKELEGVKELYQLAGDSLSGMDIALSRKELTGVLKSLHSMFFYPWEDIRDFSGFSSCLDTFMGQLTQKGSLEAYPLNLKAAERIFQLIEELRGLSFGKEEFPAQDIFRVFLSSLEGEKVSFSGSPLKGLQVLGLFETRSLSFKHVIVIDANEAVLPALRVYEPLIGRDVAVSLGLNRLEKEEEIQRYQFMRLLGAAEEVHLIYAQSPEKEKSRFVEELIWEAQKAKGSLEAVEAPLLNFSVRPLPARMEVLKSCQALEVLKEMRFSASGLDAYLRCPLSFYFRYVLGLQEKEGFREDLEGSDVGNFLHRLLEKGFRPFINRRPAVNKAFKEKFFRDFSKKFDGEFKNRMRSDSFMLKEIMQLRLERFLENEASRKVGKILCLEQKVSCLLKLGERSFPFEGKIDRLDQLNDSSLLILDYKSGFEEPLPAKDLASMLSAELSRKAIRDSVKSFQLPLYFYFVRQIYPQGALNAGLYSLRSARIRTCLKDEEIAEADQIMEGFKRPLEFILEEILDPAAPFKGDDSDARQCRHCQFFYICR